VHVPVRRIRAGIERFNNPGIHINPDEEHSAIDTYTLDISHMVIGSSHPGPSFLNYSLALSLLNHAAVSGGGT
jgi:hypothetical protein